MWIRCADHVTPLYPPKLALTSPTCGGRSLGIVRSRTKATEFFIHKYIVEQHIKSCVFNGKNTVGFFFFFAEENLGDGYMSPVAAVTEDKSESVLKTEQLAVARNSQDQPFLSNLLSEKLNSLARSLDEFRVRIPSDEESDSCGEQKDDEGEKEDSVKQMATKMKPRNIPAVRKPVDINMDYCDTSSGLWRMLSAYDDLVLSQPGYNTFGQDVKHWLESDTVPWEIMEESRRKCLEWLEKQYKQQVPA